MYSGRLIPALAVALAALLGPAALRSEASELQKKLSTFARQIAGVMKDESQTEIALGDWTGPPEPASSSGPGIQNILVVELGKHDVKINQKAALTVKGEYIIADEENRKEELIVRLVLTIRNKSARVIRELSDDLTFKGSGNEEIVKILGLNVDLGKQVKATPEDRNYEIKRQVENPKPVYVDNNKVQTKSDSPYAVEVLVKGYNDSDFKPAGPKVSGGNPFVELKRGDEYIIRLHNNSKHEAAAVITVDGVDAFAFFDAKAGKPTSFLVLPGKPREVKGWHRDFTKLNAFLVGAYSESAAAKVLRNPGKLGTINVCFHPCWEQGKTPPEYDGSRSSDQNGTGLGREQEAKTKPVPRTIGPLVTAITIRYNK